MGHTDDKHQIVIVGAGRVGATTAYAALVSGIADTITLVDFDPKRAEGEAMDLMHGLPYVAPATVRAAGYEACREADVIIVTAGAARQPGDTRLELAKRNLAAFAEIVPKIAEQTREAVLIIVSNPVDLLTLAAQRISGLPPSQVVGTGTVLDTSRLRAILGEHFAVDARNAHAFVVGEHGDSQVTLWSAARVAGLTLPDFARAVGKDWNEDLARALEKQVTTAGAEVIKRKGATNFSIGLVAAHLARTILRDERSILTASSVLHGEYGLADVALSIPCVVGREGCAKTLAMSIDAGERAALEASAAALRKVYADIGGPKG
ncbi:MAG: L-lactate dehydrogenase [Proteobacteria bacterium]|jgi:L-lactate dehydrogenase|nr:L-lactate dehydrogenase [Pseudomonadota bacterium]